MDSHIKEGQLYVQHQKFGKKWKKSWFVLYPASQNGIARLEFYDYSGGGASDKPNTKKLDKKIIRLSECISILPSMTEACPKDTMSAFCVETNDKIHVFAAEKSISTEWVEKMCEIAFGVSSSLFQGGSGSHSSLPDSNGGQTDITMAENLIYYSREEVSEFWVTVQRTDASERCGLSGAYWLKADKESLILKISKNKANVMVWPYKLLRRYGRDKVMFSFEAGRRCESGPGNFTFETKQGNEIFVIVEQAIQSQKVLAEERHLSNQMNSLEFEPSPPLTQGRSSGGFVADSNSSPDGDSSSGGSKPGSADGVFWRKEGDGGKSQVQNLKGRTLPEPPPLVIGVGGTPPRSPMSRGKAGGAPMSQEELGSVYSEPADCIRAPSLSPGDYLYSDPVDTLKSPSPNAPIPVPRIRSLCEEGGSTGVGGGNQSNSQPEPLYSDLYDRITLDLITRVGAMGLEGGGGRIHLQGGQAEATATSSTSHVNPEHIYDEPEGRERNVLGTGLGVAPVYDKAQTDPQRRTKGSDAKDPLPKPHEGPNKFSSDSFVVPPYGKQPPLQLPLLRGPGGVKWPPKPAPKPNMAVLPRKEPVPLPLGKTGLGGPNNVNNNNSSRGGEYKAGGGEEGSGRGRNSELYSKVSRYKTPSNSWLAPRGRPSPGIMFDNLGDI